MQVVEVFVFRIFVFDYVLKKMYIFWLLVEQLCIGWQNSAFFVNANNAVPAKLFELIAFQGIYATKFQHMLHVINDRPVKIGNRPLVCHVDLNFIVHNSASS